MVGWSVAGAARAVRLAWGTWAQGRLAGPPGWARPRAGLVAEENHRVRTPVKITRCKMSVSVVPTRLYTTAKPLASLEETSNFVLSI